MTNPTPGQGPDQKIPLKLIVVAVVAALCGIAIGALTWLSTREQAAAVLAGAIAAAGVLAWLHENTE